MHFTEDEKLCRIIQADIDLLPVLNRFNIKTGVQDKTVAEVCEERNINISFFLSVINTYYDPDFFPTEILMNVSPQEILAYLKSTHNYYFQYKLPQIETLLNQLFNSCNTNRKQASLIKIFYEKYKRELVAHIEDEEHNVFPEILKLFERHEKKPSFSISVFEKEHTNVDEKLNDLKNLIIKYMESDCDDFLCYSFLKSVIEFEKDIKDHARIEDKILIPQILALEEKRRRRDER